MVTVLLTGGIGSGKSAVRRILEGMGVPCYDADSAVKGFYEVSSDAAGKPSLLPEIEVALGRRFRRSDGSFDSRALAGVIFSDAAKLKAVEDIVFPSLAADFVRWRKAVASRSSAAVPEPEASAAMDGVAEGGPPAGVVVFESATALDKPDFPKVWDKCLWVDAPEELRIERVTARDRCTREDALTRIRLQSPLEVHRGGIDAVILNDRPLEELSAQVRSALDKL